MTSERQPVDGWFIINNLNIHYLDWGGSSDKPLILLPGGANSAHYWDTFAQSVCNDYRVYALDQRGRGDSDHAHKDGYALTECISDIAEFVKALGLEKFDICGQSLGGRHTIGYAGTYPETVKHAIISDIGPEMSQSGSKRANTQLLSPPMAFRSEDEAIEYFRQIGPKYTLEQILHTIKYELRVNWAGKLVFKRDIDVLWVTGSAGKKESPMVWELLSKMTCSTLVIRGAESDILSPEIAERMMSVLPNGKFVEIPNTGHPIPVEDPIAFEIEVRRFLES
ncbi:alpha/beta fold hydrolase [Chloroflexota bacterium]